MTDSKTYLNVPYAQKDAAKALGARWDPANKKWYAPNGKNIELFAQWQIDADVSANIPESTKPSTIGSAPKPSNNGTTGVFTYPSIENFVPYSGDEPPWDS